MDEMTSVMDGWMMSLMNPERQVRDHCLRRALRMDEMTSVMDGWMRIFFS